MTSTVLENDYVAPERPYSQNELKQIRQCFFRQLHIGSVMIKHDSCKHFYFAKSKGRKEQESQETGKSDVGNCSVCWKISRTPKKWKKRARNLVNDYCCYFAEPRSFHYFELVELEKDFYTWLYNEFNPNNKE